MITYYNKADGVFVPAIPDFSLAETLECGQCFRAAQIRPNQYFLIAHGRLLTITQEDASFFFAPCTVSEFETLWMDYFDLARDYGKIKRRLSREDVVLREATAFAGGIRILKQDFFECLLSFIISQNSSIAKIRQVVQLLSQRYGEYLGDVEAVGGLVPCHSFPSLDKLAPLSIQDYRACKAGFRDKYLYDAVQRLRLGELADLADGALETPDLRRALMQIKGVGQKVADCVLLFSLMRYETFPTDVWVKRIMQYFYFGGKDTPIGQIHHLAEAKYGEYAGFAQQYLFHYARKQQLGK